MPRRTRATARLRAAVTLPRIILALIVAAAATGYAWSLDTAGLEVFYAAGVRSMAGSWHAFFYDAFDPHATITLDKLPGAFWIQALSVRCFGFSVWAMVLPQVLESTLTVLVLYRAVRRTAGTAAALTAAAILAASPITIASTRGNLSEPLYLLCIVLAADATLRAVTTGRARPWYVAAIWVAIGFQAKMTEAWLVLPILACVLVMAVPTGRRRMALRAGAGVALAAGLSLVWVLCFALTPAADRPYADGSTDNSIFQQVFVYNGAIRFGTDPGGYLKPLAAPGAQAEDIARANQEASTEFYAASELTRPGWDRLLTGPLARDCDWFLLPAAGGALAAFAARRRAGRGDPVRAATVLWSAWLLGYGAAFSSAHVIQGYYLATLIPAIAALAGTGAWTLWRAARAGSRRAGLALGLLVLGQAVWAVWLLSPTYPELSRLILAVTALAALAAALAIRGSRRAGGRPLPARRLIAVVTAAAVFTGPITAAVWLEVRAGGPFDTALNSEGTLARPTLAAQLAQAQSQGLYGGTIHPQYLAGQWAAFTHEIAGVQAKLASAGTEELIFSSAEASDYVLYGETSILPVGGFSGDVPSPSVAQIQQLIAAGKISYAIVPSEDVITGNDPRIQVIEHMCQFVNDSTPPESYVFYMCARGYLK
jgi:4-amino-4-deoxy-L-arabinose transferase-like glycosyltransferase